MNNVERIYQNLTVDKWSDKVALSAPPSDIFIIYLHTLEQFHVDFRNSHISLAVVQITVTNYLFSRTIFWGILWLFWNSEYEKVKNDEAKTVTPVSNTRSYLFPNWWEGIFNSILSESTSNCAIAEMWNVNCCGNMHKKWELEKISINPSVFR